MQTGKTYVTFVVDRSSSMGSLAKDVQSAFDSLAETVRDQSKNQDTRVSLFTFADRVKEEFTDVNAQHFWKMDTYRPQGNTALYDAIGQAVQSAEGMHDAAKPHVSFMLTILTDGEENQSKSYSRESIRRLIQQKQTTGRWTFTLQVPPGARRRIADDLGVPEGNIREWEASYRGLIETTRVTQSGFTDYFGARSKGVMAVQSFYAQPDLSNVQPADVRKTLTDLQRRFLKSPLVPAEQPIKDFVEHITAKPYQVGTAFYQLTKPEKVQASKQLLLMEKGKTAVWGGPEARQLIGLPYGTECKVEPGNHANYDIFVQSTSTNRKLVRGTKVLVER